MDSRELRDRIGRLENALRPFAHQQMSDEHWATTDIAWSAPMRLRRQAAEIERRDAEIREARAVLGEKL